MIEEISARFPYWAVAILLVIGLYGMIGKRSLVKTVSYTHLTLPTILLV